MSRFSMERPGTTQHMLSWPSRRIRSMKNTMISIAGTPKKSEIRNELRQLGRSLTGGQQRKHNHIIEG